MTVILNSLIALIPFALLLFHTEGTKDFFPPADRHTSTCWRGFFALTVILHHMSQRITDQGLMIIYYNAGYIAVAMFFFWTGYGLMKKGTGQKEGFFRRRLLRLLIPFLITMILYWILYAVSGDVKSIGGLFLQLFSTASGISFLWYVYVYLFWILFFGISLRFIGKDRQIITVSVLFALLFIVCSLILIPYYFWIYDTVLLIPFGCIFAYREERITGWIRKHYVPALVCSIILFSVCTSLTRIPFVNVPLYMISALLFAFILLTVSMKRRPAGRILSFLGNISYEIYLLHGIPITFLRNLIPNDALWVMAVLITAVPCAWFLHRVCGRLYDVR